MAQTVFQRYEKKYLLDREQYTALRDQLSGRMREDRYGRYTICNIYYDTPDYQLKRSCGCAAIGCRIPKARSFLNSRKSSMGWSINAGRF